MEIGANIILVQAFENAGCSVSFKFSKSPFELLSYERKLQKKLRVADENCPVKWETHFKNCRDAEIDGHFWVTKIGAGNIVINLFGQIFGFCLPCVILVEATTTISSDRVFCKKVWQLIRDSILLKLKHEYFVSDLQFLTKEFPKNQATEARENVYSIVVGNGLSSLEGLYSLQNFKQVCTPFIGFLANKYNIKDFQFLHIPMIEAEKAFLTNSIFRNQSQSEHFIMSPESRIKSSHSHSRISSAIKRENQMQSFIRKQDTELGKRSAVKSSKKSFDAQQKFKLEKY